MQSFFIVVFLSFRNFNIKSTSGCKKNSRFGVRNINVLPSPFVPYPVWSVIPKKQTLDFTIHYGCAENPRILNVENEESF